MKKTYSPPELEVIRLQSQDIITSSADWENEVPAEELFNMG